MTKDSKTKAFPKKIDLSSVIDLDLEADKFELAPARVLEIADEITKDPPTTVNFSITQRESELRDRLKVVYDQEIADLSQCTRPGCDHKFVDIFDFLAHHRIHLIEGPDSKIAAAVIRDIERALVPTVEKSISTEGALPFEERQRLIEALKERKLLN